MTNTQDLTDPFVAVHVNTTGIHPSTGRLLTIDVVTFTPDGKPVEKFYSVVNPAGDPGPRHMHGVDYQEFEQAPRFSRYLKQLDQLIDGRTLIIHDGPKVWGFIVSEARRAMNATARANRSRNRGRGRRRQRVGHVPRPEAIVDTLASARHQSLPVIDARPNSVARLAGLDVPEATATVERAARPDAEVSREATLMLMGTYLALTERGALVSREPDELTADRFGLQRSAIRVEAEKADPKYENPGVYSPETGVQPGMEFIVTDDVEVSPDALIQAGLDAGLTYSEKLTRTASMVVTNSKSDLRGKAMHAHRKGIPLLTDKDFLSAVAGAGK